MSGSDRDGDHLGDELSAMVDGELTSGERAVADAHLASCERCRAELEATRRVRSALRSLPPVEPAGGLTLSLRRPFASAAAVAVTAAAAVLVLLFAVPDTASQETTARLVDLHLGAARSGAAPTTSAATLLTTPVSVTLPAPATPAGDAGAATGPEKLAGAYVRISTDRRGDVVHHVFTDGRVVLSLFTEPADVVRRPPPAPAAPVRVGGREAVRYEWGGAEVLTWEAGGVLHTLVADAPLDVVLAAARSVPAPRTSSAERVRRASRRVAEAVSGG